MYLKGPTNTPLALAAFSLISKLLAVSKSIRVDSMRYLNYYAEFSLMGQLVLFSLKHGVNFFLSRFSLTNLAYTSTQNLCGLDMQSALSSGNVNAVLHLKKITNISNK